MPAELLSTAAAPTALAATLRRLRKEVPRTLLYLVVTCLAIAAVLYAFDARRFTLKLLYSMCIGSSCMLVIDGGRLLLAGAFDAVRRLRGLAPSDSGFGSGWRGLFLLLPLAVTLGPLLGTWLADTIGGLKTPSLLDWGNTSTRITMTFALVGTGAAVFAASTMERLAHARALAEAAQRTAAENQLKLLQSQLEPHMLFNTLANLRVLIGLDPLRAQAMLDHLIAFLRATLSASRRDAHPLADEFRHIDDYLALMAVRMGPRLQVSLALPPELASHPVPPLLLQPLVENAIKHGLEPKVDGGRLEVSARLQRDSLQLSVRDTGVGLAAIANPGTGFGLEQVRKRLATLFGERASLDLQAAAEPDGGAIVILQLPFTPTP